MPGWDYRVLRFTAATLAALEDTLRQHGADGWEAVGMLPHTSDQTTRRAAAGGLLVLLKRPLAPSAELGADRPPNPPPAKPSEPHDDRPAELPADAPPRPRWRFW
jgi:hypothetical protein